MTPSPVIPSLSTRSAPCPAQATAASRPEALGAPVMAFSMAAPHLGSSGGVPVTTGWSSCSFASSGTQMSAQTRKVTSALSVILLPGLASPGTLSATGSSTWPV